MEYFSPFLSIQQDKSISAIFPKSDQEQTFLFEIFKKKEKTDFFEKHFCLKFFF